MRPSGWCINAPQTGSTRLVRVETWCWKVAYQIQETFHLLPILLQALSIKTSIVLFVIVWKTQSHGRQASFARSICTIYSKRSHFRTSIPAYSKISAVLVRTSTQCLYHSLEHAILRLSTPEPCFQRSLRRNMKDS